MFSLQSSGCQSRPLLPLQIMTAKREATEQLRAGSKVFSQKSTLTFHWPEQVTEPHLITGGEKSVILAYAEEEEDYSTEEF